jgi:hypothetical protein
VGDESYEIKVAGGTAQFGAVGRNAKGQVVGQPADSAAQQRAILDALAELSRRLDENRAALADPAAANRAVDELSEAVAGPAKPGKAEAFALFGSVVGLVGAVPGVAEVIGKVSAMLADWLG